MGRRSALRYTENEKEVNEKRKAYLRKKNQNLFHNSVQNLVLKDLYRTFIVNL